MQMKKEVPLIVANWKMNPPTVADAKRLLEATKRAMGSSRSYDVIIAPPAIFLRELAKGYKGKRIQFAAQNMHWEPSGSFTGELSGRQVKDAGASYVLVGHAERRGMGETNDDVRKKMAMAAANNLKPILCIGESERRPDGEYWRVIGEQLVTALRDVPKNKLKDIVIAYEPVWAIGAPSPMQPEEMHGTTIYVRKVLGREHGRPGMQLPILYGGAIDETSAGAMLTDGYVEGLLVGRASVDGRQFARLLEAVRSSQARR